jgi:hypothetical protein
MGAPECSRYGVTLALVRQLTAADRAIKDLHCYLTSFAGAQFDQLANRQRPYEFTSEDFQAVRKLNVSVLVRARQSLLGDAKPGIQRLLGAIPDDLDTWEVSPGDYDCRLGPGSAAWQLWQLVFEQQKGARSAGRGVTAGKLLHAKRPRLIPIFDRARISKALRIDHRHFWEAVWCAFGILRSGRGSRTFRPALLGRTVCLFCVSSTSSSGCPGNSIHLQSEHAACGIAEHSGTSAS